MSGDETNATVCGIKIRIQIEERSGELLVHVPIADLPASHVVLNVSQGRLLLFILSHEGEEHDLLEVICLPKTVCATDLTAYLEGDELLIMLPLATRGKTSAHTA